MSNKAKWLKLMLMALSMLTVLGCVTVSNFFDLDEDGSGKGAIYHSLTFPESDNKGKTTITIFDSYLADLEAAGWENIESSSIGNGFAQISAVYYFDLAAGKGLPDDLQDISIKIEETEDGEKRFIFEGTYDYSEFMGTWNQIISGESFDFGELFGDVGSKASKEEIDEFIDQYGEPVFETKVKLPGDTPIEATGAWMNAQEFLNGDTDTLVFSWNPNMQTTGALHAVSLWQPEEEPTQTPTPTEEATEDPNIDEDKVGMPCNEYCLSQDPIGFVIEGDKYPNCKCDCGAGNTFLHNKCFTNADLCSGEGMQIVREKDGSSICMCTDPTRKYDLETQKCVNLDGTECNHGNGCEPQFGENCSNCSDCGCSFGSGENSQYDQYLTCNPAGTNADIYGCVFEMPDKSTQLQIMNEEWNQCRNAWAIMNLAGGYGQTADRTNVMGNLTDLNQVQVWQQKSGCIPTAGLVIGREEVDPMICLIRYCDRINTAIHELERQISNEAAILRGPSIKINPPDANVVIGPLQIPRFTGQVSIFGDRANALQSPLGVDFVHSTFEIVNNPETGMQIYLFDGSYTHTYIDTASNTAKQETITAGEMLSLDLTGAPILREPFDPASRDPWWNNVDYLANCPDNSTQRGPDCYCNDGFIEDIELEKCLPVTDAQMDSAIESDVDETMKNKDFYLRQFMQYSLICCSSVLFIAIIIVLLIIRGRKNKLAHR